MHCRLGEHQNSALPDLSADGKNLSPIILDEKPFLNILSESRTNSPRFDFFSCTNSPVISNLSRTSNFLETSLIGRLSVGWQDEPDIVAMFLSGQHKNPKEKDSNFIKHKSTDSLEFNEFRKSMFNVPKFELKPSCLLRYPSKSMEELKDTCTCVSKSDLLKKSTSGNQLCEYCLSARMGNLSKLKKDVLLNLKNISAQAKTLVSNSSQESINDVADQNASNFFSTTIISPSQAINADLHSLPTYQEKYAESKDLTIFTRISPETKTKRSPSSVFQTASTPSKTSESEEHFTFQTPSQPQQSLRDSAYTPNTRKCQATGEHTRINPFDSCAEVLQMPTVSPSLFKEVISPSSAREDANFRWSIEQIALLNPASIETPTSLTSSETSHDPEYEKKAQEYIDTYFSRRCVLPSPWMNVLSKKQCSSGVEATQCKYSLPTNPISTSLATPQPRIRSDPAKGNKNDKPALVSCTVACQTELSFPAVLPPHIEQLLAPYYNRQSSHDDVESSNLINNTSLRRRLLFSNDELSSEAPSYKSSTDMQNTPYKACVYADGSPGVKSQVIADTPQSGEDYTDSCSPIVSAIHPEYESSFDTRKMCFMNIKSSVSPAQGSLNIEPEFSPITLESSSVLSEKLTEKKAFARSHCFDNVCSDSPQEIQGLHKNQMNLCASAVVTAAVVQNVINVNYYSITSTNSSASSTSTCTIVPSQDYSNKRSSSDNSVFNASELCTTIVTDSQPNISCSPCVNSRLKNSKRTRASCGNKENIYSQSSLGEDTPNKRLSVEKNLPNKNTNDCAHTNPHQSSVSSSVSKSSVTNVADSALRTPRRSCRRNSRRRILGACDASANEEASLPVSFLLAGLSQAIIAIS